MTTAFETELTATLQELADEVGTGADELATVAYRDGRRLRRRRTVLTAVASVVALAVLAVPAVTAAVLHDDSTTAAARTRVSTTVTLHVAALPGMAADMSQVRDVLRKRFAGAGLPATISSTTSGEIEVTIKGRVPTARIEPLIVPAHLQLRTVLNSVSDIGPNSPVPAPAVGVNIPTLAQVQAKLGSAYQVAAGVTDPSLVTQAIETRLAPFATLSPAEVSVLPPVMQFAVPMISCSQLLARPYGSTLGPAASSQIVACERNGNGPMTKYLLDVAKVGSADLAGAVAADNIGGSPVNVPGWEIDLSLNGPGEQKWSNLTAQLFAEADPANNTYKEVAIMVDSTVLTAPQITAQITGPITISGGFTKATATSLANLLRAGALPVALSVTSVSVS